MDFSLYNTRTFDNFVTLDKRHVEWIYDILMLGFDTCLEIGTFQGASLTAFMEAYKQKKVKNIHVADIAIRDDLKDYVQQYNVPVQVHMDASVNVLKQLGKSLDFVFVDGDHSMQTVPGEVEQLINLGVNTILAHDTNSASVGYLYCEGAYFLKQNFQSHPDYYCLEDNKKRDGERTDRGLFLATKSKDIWQKVKQIMPVD